MSRGRPPLGERLGLTPGGRSSARRARHGRIVSILFLLLFIFTIPIGTVGAASRVTKSTPPAADPANKATAQASIDLTQSSVSGATSAPAAVAPDATPQPTLNPAVF